ncbi:MAG: hypothetical protein MUC48_01340 [Leptolyngbya sp. Prado105]|jgi:hypothetical protein|nr:hypothetical protein [Leptolyngbya sp. Prado105]
MRLKDLLIACSFDAAEIEPLLETCCYRSMLTWNRDEYCLDNQKISTPFDLIEILRQRAFQAVLIFTQPHQSCYSLAYLCYLAGIPIRIGQSVEFAGGVLSTWIKPIAVPAADYHLHLLKSCDLEF